MMRGMVLIVCVLASAVAAQQVFTGDTVLTWIDAESEGNVICVPAKLWIPAASCNNATAALNWDAPTTNAAAAACITGTNTQKGVADFDAATDESLQLTLRLPEDWMGDFDVDYKWLANNNTSGHTTRWCAQVVCVADDETDDPAFDTADCVEDDVKTGAVNRTNDATLTLNSTETDTCAAGELLHLRVYRDADHGNDDMTGDARLIGVEVTLRRGM